MGVFTMLTLVVITVVFAFTFTGISLSSPARNRTGYENLENGKIDPELDSQQMVINAMWKYVLPNELLKFSESREQAGKAIKWGCRFLYKPCSWLNALNPFTDTDCCVGSCLMTWSSWGLCFIEWKCIPPYNKEYAQLHLE